MSNLQKIQHDLNSHRSLEQLRLTREQFKQLVVFKLDKHLQILILGIMVIKKEIGNLNPPATNLSDLSTHGVQRILIFVYKYTATLNNY